jgi:hypothetical protein
MSKADLRDIGPKPNPQAPRAKSGGGNKVKAVGTVSGHGGRAHDPATAAAHRG